MEQAFDEICIKIGNKVRYDGHTCEITSALTLDEVMLKDLEQGITYSAKISKLSALDNTKEGKAGADDIQSDLTFLYNQCIWDQAKHREEFIKKLALNGSPRKAAKEAAETLKISDRQIYKLISKYRNSGFKLTSLLPKSPNGGKGKSRLPDQVEQIIIKTISEIYLNKQRYRPSYVIQEIKARCRNIHIKPPSDNTIRDRIEKLTAYKKNLSRKGKKAAEQFVSAVPSIKEIECPLSVVQIDHTKVDIIIVDDVYRQPIGRPYLTVAIDCFSRCITGFCLTLEAPSATSIGLCLTHSVFEKDEWLEKRGIEKNWPIWGKPDCIYVDNAKEFHSEAMQRGCDFHSIKLEFRPVGKPHYGGIVERVIGTLMDLVHGLPGTTFSNIQDKGQYDSEGKAVLTLAELEKWLSIVIVDYYHQKIHKSINLPPIEKYKQGIFGYEGKAGRGYPHKIKNRKAFLIDFLPIERRTLQRCGFVLDHIAYYSNSLSPLIADRKKHGKFIIRRDPCDLSKIFVLDPISKYYLEIPFRSIHRPTITLWEHRAAIKRLREVGDVYLNEDKIFDTIEQLKDIAKKAAKSTKSARKNLARTTYALKRDKMQDNCNVEQDMENAGELQDELNEEAEPFKDIELW